MYWPIGTPKVYALSKHGRSRTKTVQSEDGVSENAESTEPTSSSGVGSSDVSRQSGDIAQDNGVREVRNGHTSATAQDIVSRESEILGARISRGGSIFATITRSTLTVWQAKPTVALASVVRSPQSMQSYGANTALLLRSDALIIVIQTAHGYLITYSLATDPNARVYATQLASTTRHARSDSIDQSSFARRQSHAGTADAGSGEGDGIREVNIRFRMVLRIDAGISTALALEDELIVATQRPAALQCIRWVADNTKQQTSTELLSKMPWILDTKGSNVIDMVHDRPMNLTCWVTSEGRAYAVQRRGRGDVDMDNQSALFSGFCFRQPETDAGNAVKAAINARFSLIAVACASGEIEAYAVKDYMGNIPFSHKLRPTVSATASGMPTCLTYSPDGYCLFAGYEHGWATWSVNGKLLASSFSTDRKLSNANDELWLHGIRDALFFGGGCELALVPVADDRIWVVDMARSGLAGCYSPATLSRGLLYSSANVMLFKGHDLDDLTSLPADMSLWQTIQVPATYLLHQWPIKSAIVSADGKYIAVAGRRGLAHYSVASGRWKTFDDPAAEHEFAVRGGMTWYQHFLIAGVDASNRFQIRIYSRDKALAHPSMQQIEDLAAPAIFVTVSGDDSLLVYTYDNTLLHYILVPTSSSVRLVQVGQIGFHGIIRAPPRVRAISWILPDAQLEHGDPSQDVATASVLFLVDGKLVLLQPSTNEEGMLKYDMRVIAQGVEFYILLRDTPMALPLASQHTDAGALPTTPNGLPIDNHLGHSLRDSLWYFDGSAFHVWSDVQDVLACAPAELGRDLPPTVRVPIDFYPITAMIGKGVISGIDADLVQRRDTNFSFFRHSARTQLFFPPLLRYHLGEYNSPAALHLSHSYEHLPYFAHALEVLLHTILDAEVDNPPDPPETALLPTAISFLSSFPAYLDIVVNCTRKTELRSWRTLFLHLPPVVTLFEESLAQGKLKTAAGYLLVLHTFQQEAEEFELHECAKLLRRAAEAQDWELCRELAKFLVGIDQSGNTLKMALDEAGLTGRAPVSSRPSDSRKQSNGVKTSGPFDYFSFPRRAT